MTERVVKQKLGPIRIRRKLCGKDPSLYDLKYVREQLDFNDLDGDKIRVASSDKSKSSLALSSIFPMKSGWVTWPVLVSLIFRFASGPIAQELKQFLCPEPQIPVEKPTPTRQKSKGQLGTNATAAKKLKASNASDALEESGSKSFGTSTMTSTTKGLASSPSFTTPTKRPELEREDSQSSWERPNLEKSPPSRQKLPTTRTKSGLKHDNSNSSLGGSGNASPKANKHMKGVKEAEEQKPKMDKAGLRRQLSKSPSMRTDAPDIKRVDHKQPMTKVQAQQKAKEKKQTKQRRTTQLRREGTMKLVEITTRDKKMEVIFKKLDKTNSGKVGIDELKDALQKWGVELSHNNLLLLTQCFGNNTKTLNYQQFVEFLGFYTELRKCFEEGGNGINITRAKLGTILASFKYKFSSNVVQRLSEFFSRDGSNMIWFQDYFTLLVHIRNLDKELQEFNTSKKQVFLAAPQFHTLLRSFGIYMSVTELDLFLSHLPDKSKLCFIKFEDLVNLIVELKQKRTDIAKMVLTRRAEERQKVMQDPISSQNFRISRTKRVVVGTMSFGQKREKIRATMVVKVEEALIQAEKQFQQALAEASKTSTKKYIDASFPPKLDSLCKNDCPLLDFYRKTITSWRRPSEISTSASLFLESIDEGDLAEGALKDTWYLSAIAVLGANGNEGTVKDLFVFKDEHVGIYVCRFWLNGKWSYVVVDDYLPCNAEKVPAFGKCRNPNEFWVSILEKAYAKLYGSYYKISRDGNITDALVDFTGEASEVIPIKDSDRFWQTLMSYFKKSFLLTVVCEDKSAGKVENSPSQKPADNPSKLSEAMGIYPNYAYTILECHENEGNRLIRLRNAWGKPDWNGRWSNGSEEWTPALVDHFSVEFLPGIFFMNFEDFAEHFTTLSVLRLPSMDEFGMLWKKYEINGEWNSETSGGSFNVSTWTKNPQYEIRVSRDTELFISLKQSDKRRILKPGQSLSEAYPPIGFFILRKETQNDFRLIASDSNGSDLELITTYDSVRENSASFFAEKNGTYVLIPSTYSANTETEFSVTVFSNFPIGIKPLLEREIEYASAAGVWDDKTSGGSFDHNTWRKNPQFLLRVSEPGNYSVVLEQISNERSQQLFYIGTQIWKVEAKDEEKHNEKHSKKLGIKRKVAYSNAMHVPSYANSPLVKVSRDFEPGEYILMCATYNPQEFAKFSLKIVGKKEQQESRKYAELFLLDNPWTAVSLAGEWNESNCGGCSNYDTHYINPKYHLTIPESCLGNLTVVIEQDNKKKLLKLAKQQQGGTQEEDHEDDLQHIGFYLFMGETANEESLVGVSEYVNSSEVSQNFQMEEGTQGVYTIMPTTYYPMSSTHSNNSTKFKLSVFCLNAGCILKECK